ncbi:cytochrome C [Geothermobacter hydrogeniphilus]|uniref:Cytochrome C n=1 Tax=Geothermobacter hydrogeniphilus TaxID=1969733 RepID=A0A2K2H8Z7_9BACT|nr:cytochrome c3 family protein [Geothermobacter hydrogeniphilus]PNU19741.1 cytochrome C [Geothermobacter hydrogeniphilus]
MNSIHCPWLPWAGLFIVFLLSAVPASASESCLDCHSENCFRLDFPASVHGPNGCTSCHRFPAGGESHPVAADYRPTVDCNRCHKDIAQAYASGVHQAAGVGCSECHAPVHGLHAWRENKEKAVELCLGCHDREDYRQSVHGRAVARGNADSASCHDCHGLHDVRAVSPFSPEQAQAFNVDTCIPCHADKEKMTRNGVRLGVVASYLSSHHGKSYRLGSTRRAAGCADCHTAHRVLPKSDPASSLHGGNLVKTCRQCHARATASFTRYYPHGDHHDRDNYPLLYWTFLAMNCLLIGVFAFFWIHSVLWMFRGFVENRKKLAAAARGEGIVVHAAHKQYRRFSKHHILFHLIVITSFLGLSLTGLPLKFSDQPWAQTLMSFYGGVAYAGLLHRACAVLTFYYFVAALLLSINFLFISKKPSGNCWQRLFGPDSLMPNGKDARDLLGMVRWFLFRGPKPEFERWTYWEKFDFLAVFWGMVAIGSSGLLLWFPEFFGQFLPGWVFNVAIIIHSDEALLATGFIFTVHFFNTHGRPEKFPMDFVIFNGQISRQEFIEERSAQWRRYREAGVIEQFEIKKPSGVVYDFILKGFGFLALFTGLALAFLMLIAFIRG